jgi:antitoxin YefM
MSAIAQRPLRRCRPSEDVVPFSECRNNFSAYIGQVQSTHRPILVTQNGRAASYLVNATDFDDLMDTLDLMRDVEISRREIAEGKGIPHEQVMAEMRERINRVATKKANQ